MGILTGSPSSLVMTNGVGAGEFPVQLMPGEQCPHCGLRRPKDSRDWAYNDGEHSYVPIERVRFVFIEIAHRVGNAQGARLVGTGRHNFHKIVNNKNKKFVERRTAKAALHVLKYLRDNDVVYSRRSIRRGSVARGEQPQRPTQRGEFYRDPGALEEDRIRKHKAVQTRQQEEEDRLQNLTGY